MKNITPVGAWISSVLCLITTATACAGGSTKHLIKRDEEGYAGGVTPEPVTCQSVGTCPYANNSMGPWTPEANLRQFQLTDDAFNSFDLSKFNHRDDTLVYMPGERVFNMAQHVQDIMFTYASYPDNHVHNHPYKVSLGEGNWTLSLSDCTGTNTGAIQSPEGWRGPTGRRINYEFMTAALWEEGHIVKEYIWMDLVTVQRQLGFFSSSVPAEGAQSLSLSPYTWPLATNPDEDVSQDNKQFLREVGTALNNGEFTAEGFRLSPNATIFTSREDTPNGLDNQQFLALVERLAASFSDVRLEQETIIGQGDWTASIGRLSGRHTGALEVPGYISDTPIPSLNNTFGVYFYTIARWQNGQVTHLKVMIDVLAILDQIQLE
ncbi:hypothetical protein F66182_8460 [Fusarium sp. NRRL 66182]|nr:hypothetical protein F66182_8460 [Fusarium sp. NRRL 66182]